MGCAGSKSDADANATGTRQKESSNLGTKTSSGYISDIAVDRPALVGALVHDHTRERVDDVYECSGGAVLGRGACGSVTAVRKKATGEMYAMKSVSLETMGGTVDELHREIEIQRALDHPNICKIFECFEDERHGEIHIIMELCTGATGAAR